LSLGDVKVNTGSSSGFAIVPTGRYTVVVGSAEIKETKNGSALILGYMITDGEHEGKQLKDFLNVVNPSEKAVSISLERLATVAWATNASLKKGVLEDTDDLLNQVPFDVSVEQVDDGEYKNMKIKAVLCTRDLEEVKTIPVPKKAAPWSKK
jgi:hypothetical protein